MFESAVITWTKQIKKILNRDPEDSLKSGQNPTPDKELAFWTFQSVNLNSIYDQLQSEQNRMVLRFLDMSKSTYCTPFANLIKEVVSARHEANDNNKYMRNKYRFVKYKFFWFFKQSFCCFNHIFSYSLHSR